MGTEVKDITDEIDFILPDGWGYARINSLVNIQTGASFKKEQSTFDKTQIRVLRGGNICNGTYVFLNNDIFVKHELISDNILLQENDLITPAVTSIENIGKVALIEQTFSNVTAGGFVFILRPLYSNNNFAKYLLYSLRSAYFNQQLKSITKKSGQAFYNLSKERLIMLVLPIPPLAELERIVSTIEKYEPLIVEYDKLEKEATALDDTIKEKLKKSILQYAIQGKLVPQDENDEPASVLLEKIRAERRAKLGKKYVDSYIYKGDDNCYYEHIDGKAKDEQVTMPFTIPESWGWGYARINTLVNIQTGASFKKEQSTFDKTQIRVLRGGNICNGTYVFLDNDIFVKHELISDNILLRENDLITPAVTSIENIGKVALIEQTFSNVTAGGFVFILRPLYSNNTFAKYLLYSLRSAYFNQQLKSITKKSGQAFYNLSKERLITLILPIPPFDEQLRIVNKISILFSKL